jgi:hypothetical protein
VSPPTLELDDLQGGETYLRTVQVQNPSDTPSGIGIQRSGEVAAWTTTDPPGNFTIPAHGVRQVALSVAVPDGAGLGNHKGQLTFIADPKTGPSGSGSTIRPSVGLLLNATVGGDPVTRLTWLSTRVEDAQSGGPVHAFAAVRNDGNVRTTAEATGHVLPFDPEADDVLSEASGSLLLQPGEEGEVPVTFAAGLTTGQYRARLRSPPADGFEQVVPFKVLPPGGQAPDGVLRAIVHVPFGKAGTPVRLDAWFENTGNLTIASAAFHGEVRKGAILLDTIDSEALVVAAGKHANLTAYWTPPKAGTYTVIGHVTYDGYQTLENQSPLNVKGGSLGFAWWWILVALAVLAAVVVVVWLVLRRKRRRGPPSERLRV